MFARLKCDSLAISRKTRGQHLDNHSTREATHGLAEKAYLIFRRAYIKLQVRVVHPGHGRLLDDGPKTRYLVIFGSGTGATDSGSRTQVREHGERAN